MDYATSIVGNTVLSQISIFIYNKNIYIHVLRRYKLN